MNPCRLGGLVVAARKRHANRAIGVAIRDGAPGVQANATRLKGEGVITKLVARTGGVLTRTEATPVLPRCVYEPMARAVSPAVEEAFGCAEINILSFVCNEGWHVFVTNIAARTISMIDVESRTVADEFSVGNGPNGITFRASK